jgi:1,2-phenylacetyl-CoA epoxidase catalytic subunit
MSGMDNESALRQSEESLVAYVAGGGRLSAPDNVTPRYRGELMRLMAVFVDSELAGASGFADCINLAPGVKERIVAARMVLEKFSNAGKVMRIMETFGANPAQYASAHPWAARLDRSADLGGRRMGGDMRLNVFHYPIYGWVDGVVMNMLMGRATMIQLEDLAQGSYQPFADALAEIVLVETRHAGYGVEGLDAALAAGYDPVAAQASVNYWHPRVAATFGRAASEHAETYRKYRLRTRTNEELLARWRAEVRALLEARRLREPATHDEGRGVAR